MSINFMRNSDFEAPPLHWSIVSIVGAIATTIALIVGLEFSIKYLRPDVQTGADNVNQSESYSKGLQGAE